MRGPLELCSGCAAGPANQKEGEEEECITSEAQDVCEFPLSAGVVLNGHRRMLSSKTFFLSLNFSRLSRFLSLLFLFHCLSPSLFLLSLSLRRWKEATMKAQAASAHPRLRNLLRAADLRSAAAGGGQKGGGEKWREERKRALSKSLHLR